MDILYIIHVDVRFSYGTTYMFVHVQCTPMYLLLILPCSPGDGPKRLASDRGSLEEVSSLRRLIRHFFSSVKMSGTCWHVMTYNIVMMDIHTSWRVPYIYHACTITRTIQLCIYDTMSMHMTTSIHTCMHAHVHVPIHFTSHSFSVTFYCTMYMQIDVSCIYMYMYVQANYHTWILRHSERQSNTTKNPRQPEKLSCTQVGFELHTSHFWGTCI